MHHPFIKKSLANSSPAMALPAMEFQVQGYKIRDIFALKINISKGNYWILRIGTMRSLSNQGF